MYFYNKVIQFHWSIGIGGGGVPDRSKCCSEFMWMFLTQKKEKRLEIENK